MRIFLGLLALTAAATQRDWTQVTTKTPAGAFVLGNPNARVKLVEYASYTCSHCAQFVAESAPVLKDRMIRDGTTSLEYRHLIRDGLDLGAAILARCAGTRGFATTSAYIYAAQDQWLNRGVEFQQINAQRIAMYPQAAQLRALADGSGLTGMVIARGLPGAAVDACFADQTEVNRILQMTTDVPTGVDATPTFFINGKLVPHVGWTGLEPQLRAAGAR